MCFYFKLSEAELIIVPEVQGKILLIASYDDGFKDEFYLTLKQIKQALFKDEGRYF